MSSTSADLRHAESPGIDYLERAREIASILVAAADEIEERRQLPERVVEALVERGFFRMLLPRSLGGAELHPLTYVQVLEEIAKADPSTAWSLGQNSGCSMIAPISTRRWRVRFLDRHEGSSLGGRSSLVPAVALR